MGMAFVRAPVRETPQSPEMLVSEADLVEFDPNRLSPAVRLPEDFVWMGEGILPNGQQVAQASDVLAAIPMAGAVGWSVRGNPWSLHARRIRTAIVPPRDDWDVRVMRGVREVDSLSGRILVRRAHLEDLAPPDDGDRFADAEFDSPNPICKAMRAAGFGLLLVTPAT